MEISVFCNFWLDVTIRNCALSAVHSISRRLKNYLRWQSCVKNDLKMLIYNT